MSVFCADFVKHGLAMLLPLTWLSLLISLFLVLSRDGKHVLKLDSLLVVIMIDNVFSLR